MIFLFPLHLFGFNERNNPRVKLTLIPTLRTKTTASKKFYLSGGCVFADFKVVKEDGNEILQLIRISFDGHGCADREELNLKMNAYDSKLLKQIIDDSAAHEDDMREIMATFIEQIRSYLWDDALRDNLDM
jgi:hypothetical protein